MSRPEPPPSWVINCYQDGATGEVRVVVRRPGGNELFPAEYGEFARELNRDRAVLSASYTEADGLRLRVDPVRCQDSRRPVAKVIAKFETRPLAEVLEFRPRPGGPLRKRSS